MRRILAHAIAPAIVALALASSHALADEVVRLRGCPIQLETNCTVLTDARGTPYDISGASARSKQRGAKRAPLQFSPNKSVALTGTVAEGFAGRCRRGVVLDNIQWKYTGEPCPAR